MSWTDIAYKEINDASRSRTLWLLVGFTSVLFLGYAVGHGSVGEEQFVAFLSGTVDIVVLLVPLLGIFLGYRSVCDDRTTGRLFLSLSFPHSRRDLITGTFVGRTAVLLVPTLLALFLAGVVGALQYGTEDSLMYPWFLFITALYGMAFVAVGVALSVATTADRRITYGAVGGYLLLVFLWSNLVSFGVTLLHRFESASPDWALLAQLVQPSEAYYRLLRVGFDTGHAGRYLGSDTPFYVDWWTALLILLLWSVVPLAVGYRRFRAADL